MAIFNFPNSREDFIRLGKEALEQGEQQKGLKLFHEAYEMEADFSLNLLIVHLMMETGDHQQALRLAQDYLSDYLKERQYFDLFFQLLLLNQQFLKAHEYLAQFEGHQDQTWLDLLHQQLTQLEDYLSQLEQQKLADLRRTLSTINQLTMQQQAGFIETLIATPLNFFLEMAASILTDVQINYFSRLKVLEELIKLKRKESFTFRWFNEKEQQVIPSQLGLVENSTELAKIELFLTQQLEHQQPDLLQALLEEVRLHLTILFPFETETITALGGVQLFAESYLVEYSEGYSEQLEESVEFNRIQELKQNLRQFIWQLMERS
ncbi:hypothetical protein [Enterococcus sp. HY326]|uniref:hypothetical protein n=1 Tax=Enterococcus sp. HY326 TaxID=2971265 RepID=UPI002240A4EB|nr:hypothetical protein [Enterococcus sp. HY326]